MTIWFAGPGRVRLGAAALALLCPLALSAQRQNGVLIGRVLSGDVAVPGAAIVVSGGGVTVARVDGRFRMSLPAGRYEVRAQRIGYTSARDTVTVAGGQTASANFRLDRALSSLESVASVSSRVFERRVIDSPSPVDVIPGLELRATGRTETSRMLQAVAPSVTAPRASVAEGSDLVHPVTMRGMGPDQVLVLVNGRRRHTSALLNVNGSTGRGSTGVDLDAIPASMIDHVEVLREGAAAQYGGEAVAGVINVVLKSGVHGDATSTVGGNVTTYNRDAGASGGVAGERSVRDGRSVQASIDKGVVFGERGFLHGDFELRTHEYTNRALPDASSARPTEVTARAGDPTRRDMALYLNGGNRLANGVELYGNLGGARRTLDAAAAFRPVGSPSQGLPSSTGFLPIIHPTIGDYAGTLGLRGTMEDWRWDLSSTYGRNLVDYEVHHQQPAGGSATSFDPGSLHFGQSTTNLDLSRTYDYFNELRLAAGAELRNESYGIRSGTGSLDIAGFPGFGPAQVVDRSRTAVAGYADAEAEATPMLVVGVAGRAERFSDVGTLGAGKLSLRFEPMSKLAFRGSVGRSQRAPSLAQSYYGNVLTDMGQLPYTTSVVRVDDPAAMAAGATALRPERATTFSVGIASEVNGAFSLSADLYRIDVADRVVLLQSLTDPTAGSSSSQFAANAADTRTQGIDLGATYALRLDPTRTVRLMGGANLSRTRVLAARSVNGLGLGNVGVTRLEHGQPNSNLLGSASYQHGTLGALLRTQRFGEVRVAGGQQPSLADQRYGAHWITDANLSVTLMRKYTLTTGVDNLFDAYPDVNASTTTPGSGVLISQPVGAGTIPYSNSSPFGFNGRHVFGRLSIYL
jgi:iron complex outermembrane receptor protein